MPSLHFLVRWPDQSEELCYSPSTVVKEYFELGKDYPLDDFINISRDALIAASQRVQAVHGFPCSNAMAQLQSIENQKFTFSAYFNPKVTILGYQS